MLRRAVLTAGIALLSLGSPVGTAFAEAPSPQGKKVQVAISGTIRNFDELSGLVVPESFLQLVPESEDGSYAIQTDPEGRFSYVSALPKAAVPEKAAFRLEMDGVPPGKYQLAAQRLKPQSDWAGRRPWFGVDAKKVLTVVVPSRADDPVEIKVGKVVVWTK